MNEKSLEILEKFLPKNYIQQGNDAKKIHENEIRILLEKCKVPETGWPDQRINLLLNELSLMDSNNFDGNCGVGEREGRIYSNIVASRHFGLAHGIGRSGDITEVQPKAVGSSIINKLTNSLALDVLKISGLTFIKSCFVVPMATGMSLTLCMLAFRQSKPFAKFVLMPRIDQKSCIKSLILSGFTPIIIENILVNDELQTDLVSLEEKINELNPDNICCIFSVSSCFAPRAIDKIEEIAKLCQKYKICHLINNAYGLQSSKCTHVINQAFRVGRVDAIVQSTDKNFMVPVGGAIIASFNEEIVEMISKSYPGRASASQSVDLLITLLSMGVDGYKNLLKERKECFSYLKDELNKMAIKYDEKVLNTPNNPISIGFTLTKFGSDKDVTQIGSMIFTRFMSGARVVIPSKEKEISGLMFKNFGSHSNNYPSAYLTVASAIGVTKNDIDIFIKKIDKIFSSLVNKSN